MTGSSDKKCLLFQTDTIFYNHYRWKAFAIMLKIFLIYLLLL